jgi:hypothetical protein
MRRTPRRVRGPNLCSTRVAWLGRTSGVSREVPASVNPFPRPFPSCLSLRTAADATAGRRNKSDFILNERRIYCILVCRDKELPSPDGARDICDLSQGLFAGRCCDTREGHDTGSAYNPIPCQIHDIARFVLIYNCHMQARRGLDWSAWGRVGESVHRRELAANRQSPISKLKQRSRSLVNQSSAWTAPSPKAERQCINAF